MTPPRLHVVTDDAVLRAAAFTETAGRILQGFEGRVALHLRGHGLPGRELYDLAESLAPHGGDAAGTLLINDRVDIAVMLGAAGVQLGRRSLPVPAARRLLGPDAMIGFSAHGRDEADAAVEAGADFVVAGNIYRTASHPSRPGSGSDLVSEVAALGVPVIAIGGVSPARVGAVLAAGALGVAVLRGVWHAPDPIAAVASYLEALEAGSGPRGSVQAGHGPGLVEPGTRKV